MESKLEIPVHTVIPAAWFEDRLWQLGLHPLVPKDWTEAVELALKVEDIEVLPRCPGSGQRNIGSRQVGEGQCPECEGWYPLLGSKRHRLAEHHVEADRLDSSAPTAVE